MNRAKLGSILYKKFTSVLLLLSVVGGLVTPLVSVFAAEVVVDGDVNATSARNAILGSASVWTSDQVGYKFYVDNSGACVYSKSTDGGTSWGVAVVVDSQTDCFGVTVWYDRWTPGDAGSTIHILTADSGNDDLWYNSLDTTTDALLLNTFPVSSVVNSGQGGVISAGANLGSITKSTDGTIYMSMNDNNDRYIVECSSNCGVSTSWTETGTPPIDLQDDWTLLMPLSGGDILLVNLDISANDIRSKVWDESTGNWSASWTTVDANVFRNTTYDPSLAAAINPTTGDIYIAYIDTANGTLGGNNDDIRTATYSGGSWTNNTDVLTNSTMGLTGVSLGVDGNTGDVYIGYTGQPTAGNTNPADVYWKSSTDGMSTWGTQQGPVNTTTEVTYGVDINIFNYHRLTVSWLGDTGNTERIIIENAMADLVPPVSVSVTGAQKASVRPQTSDFYVGGAFVINENLTSRNVTSITVSEAGTVDASNDLENIKLYYDLDTSAPYDCESESYSGSESQFGSTDTDGFSSANGTSTFTGTVGISPTATMCVYVVLDIIKYATEWTNIDVEISNPATDVLVSGGVTAIPETAQAITDYTLIKPDTDFKVQRGVSTITGDSLTITAGVDYEAPSSASSAFIRITNTGHTGAGRNTGGGTSNADDTTVYITDASNITSSVTFARGTGAINNTRVSWEIVEYRGTPGGDNEMIVRRQEPVSYASGGLTVNGAVTNTVTDDADVVVFITGQRNQSTGSTVYNRGASTAEWNAGSDLPTFTRAASGNIADVSYAIVEFTGSNWKVQRAEHAFTAAGTTQTESITAVNSLSKAFLHTQKRFSVSTHANFGHEVWLSGIGQVSFLLDAAATTPTGQVSVAWVIENTQTLGVPMDVTRSNGAIASGGTAPQSNLINIGTTVADITSTSIFTNNSSDTANNTWPEPILGVRLVSDTQYELWRSDTAANIDYRTEVVEWPTAERKFNQNYYRLYADNNALTPTDPWPAGGPDLGENTEMTANDEPTASGDIVRIRMSVLVSGARMAAGGDAFKLQYAPRVTTCGAVSTWNDIGDPASTTAHWRGVNNTPADGTALSTDPPTGGDLLISVSDVAGTYEEKNNSALNPYLVLAGDDMEYDWIVQQTAAAADKTPYCFRMVEDDGTLFATYTNYPVIRTVGYEPLMTNWRWYDDETNATPNTPLGAENVSPSNIVNQNILKLRVSLRESSGADGLDVKFALQYSEYADFSQAVHTLTSTSSCVENSIWCYADGAGVDNTVINSKVISTADACSGGVGSGCGTYNESTSTAGVTFDQIALTDTEFEFTVRHAGARTNAVYYFRLYNLTYDEVVGVAPTFSNPSLVTEGAALTSTVEGIGIGSSVAGVTIDATSTPTSITFGKVPFDTNWEAAQQITIDTNATEGYQLLVYTDQNLTNSFNEFIEPVDGTNSLPTAWTTGCLISAQSCFGYHATDATLFGGSGRFAPLDSYAQLDSTPREVMYSSIPASDIEYMLFRIRVGVAQPVGDYEAQINYIAVPVH